MSFRHKLFWMELAVAAGSAISYFRHPRGPNALRVPIIGALVIGTVVAVVMYVLERRRTQGVR